MVDEGGSKPRKLRSGTFTIKPGQPIEFTSIEVADNHGLPSNLCSSIARTLREYRKAARQLIEGKYVASRALAPPHLRLPCHILVLCCPDGVIVRYDLAGDEEMKVRSGDIPQQLREAAPIFSEQVFHFPDDPSTYIPEHQGPGFHWTIADGWYPEFNGRTSKERCCTGRSLHCARHRSLRGRLAGDRNLSPVGRVPLEARIRSYVGRAGSPH